MSNNNHMLRSPSSFIGEYSTKENIKAFTVAMIIGNMQRKENSPLYDDRLLLPEQEWQLLLSSADIKYIKDVLFEPLMGKTFKEYAQGIQSNEQKLEAFHSYLRSMYRSQLAFIKYVNE